MHQPIRPPMDSVTEFEPVEVETGEGLDKIGLVYGVTRMESEPDQMLRERVKNAVLIKRSSEKVERGESLIPAIFAEDDTDPNLAETATRAENAKLREDNLLKSEEIFRLRSIIIDIRNASDTGDWGAIGAALGRFNNV